MQIDFTTDTGLAGELAALVNDAYAEGESGLWRPGAVRVTPARTTELITAGEIAVARRAGQIVGSVRIVQLAPGLGELGMLSAAPRGGGTGRALIDFAESWARERGLPTMQLEILTPRRGTHPEKEFLRSWYTRLGYHRVGADDFAGVDPAEAANLAVPCDLVIFHKGL